MIYIYSSRFKRLYKKLPEVVKNTFRKQIKLFDESNMSHPSLRVKKIKGTGYIWEASIDMNYRFTFEKIENGVKLRVIGSHDVLKNP